MITAWFIDYRDGDTSAPILARHTAESTLEDISKYYNPEREAMPLLLEREIDTIPAQHVNVSGSLIGYQFNRNSMGARAFKRAVTNVTRDEAGTLWGEAEVLGRRVTVCGGALGMLWYAREMLGWADEETA